MKLNGVIISDIHFGVIDDIRLIHELNDVFINELNKMEKLDYIIFNGDYYDTKLFLNSRTSDIAFNFMVKIIDIAKIKRSKIRIIYGTESHDSNQYNIFNIYENNPDIDFRVIYTVEEEELFPNFYVLYLPEEYMKNKKDFYKDYFSNKNKYNYIFGHGIIKEAMSNIVRNIETKDSSRPKVPIFNTSELDYICKGLCFFGHYHINTNINDKFFYVGSFTRWCFGEEEPKGFYITTYNDKNDKYKFKFIQNYMAKIYRQFEYGYNSDIFISEKYLIKEMNRIDELLKYGIFDYVKLIINIPEEYPNTEFIINYLKERYNFNRFVKIIINNGINNKKERLSKEHTKQVIEKYNCIFDKSLAIENKIQYFIETKNGKNISLDKIKKILYDI